jgi:hypothetical protein
VAGIIPAQTERNQLFWTIGSGKKEKSLEKGFTGGGAKAMLTLHS